MDISTDSLYQLVRALFALSLLGFLFLIIRITMKDLQQTVIGGIRPTARQPRAELLSVPGEEGSAVPDGQVFEIQGVTTVGRARTARVVLDDSSVSAQHALLRPVDGTWTIEDLGSKNGTMVNGRRIQGPSNLACGDALQFGRVRLRLMC